MSIEKSKIENLIQEYLLLDGLLREKISDSKSKLDFGFIFSYPPGPKGQRMSTYKIKDKYFIVISIRTQISKSQINVLNSQKNNKRNQFFISLRKFLLLKEVFFQIDVQKYQYEINDQIYFNKDEIISKNSFFKTIRKIFYCYVYSNIILGEICSKEQSQSKNVNTDFDFSLYA